MRAVILAGGVDGLLRPLTLDRPAALLPVANRPLVEHLIEHLVRHRVEEATVALHRWPDLVETQLGDGTRWGLRLRYALERTPLGTAGAVRRVAARWSESFVLAAGTALSTADVSKVAAFHQLRSAAVTLVVASARAGAGGVLLDDEGRLVPEATPGAARFGLTGLAIIDPTALALVPPGEVWDFDRDLLPRLVAAGLPVHGYVTTEPGLVVHTPADLVEANRRAIAGEFPGLVLPGLEVRDGIRLSHGALVHPQARLEPPVLIGANAVITRGATVGATVVGDDVIVGPRSIVRNSVLLPRTHVGRALRLDGAVVDRDLLGRAAAGAWTSVADPRILGDTRAPLRPRAGRLAGRLFAGALVVVSAPVWAPVLALVALEAGGRPFRVRQVVGARGRVSRLRRVAVRGPLGRLVMRLRLTRAPHIWNVVRGDLHWIGSTPCSQTEWDALAARGESPPVPPGLVNLAHLTPVPLSRRDRRALDRLYAVTRSPARDVRLVAAVVFRRAALALRALPSARSQP